MKNNQKILDNSFKTDSSIEEILYLYRFNVVPSKHCYNNIDILKLKVLINKYNFEKILENIYFYTNPENYKEDYHLDIFNNKNSCIINYYLKDNYIFCVTAKSEMDNNECTLTIFFVDKNKFHDEILGCLKEKENNKNIIIIKFLIFLHGNIQFIDRKIDISAKLKDIDLLYGHDFININNSIVDCLNSKKSGLFMFYGKTGTGKTNYIKNIISQIPNRDFIFIPSSAIPSLSDPSFVALFINSNLKNPVLILEDAEKAIIDRSENNNSDAVSTLLNLTDGFLAEILNTTAIVTYNCDFDKIDQALIRKGRLLGKYEFKELKIEEAQKLLDYLKIDHKADKAMSIADIFNLEQKVDFSEDNKEKKKRIGF